MPVKVVTDSTSDIPADLAASLGITVVPLNVNFGTETFKDSVTLSADEFYARLTGGSTLPTTSQPSPGDFAEIYDRLGEDADGIVSVHLSSRESGTDNSAMQAKAETKAECPIEIIDSEQFSMGLGMIAMSAARAARAGAGLEEVVAAATEAKTRSECVCMFETLDYRVKGGRVGKAQGLVGSLLNIKPMIIIREGRVHQLAKVRTFAKSVARLKETARGFAPLESLAVLHSTTPDAAQALADDLSDLLPSGTEPYIARFGPVIGTYTGPGALGVGILRARGG